MPSVIRSRHRTIRQSGFQSWQTIPFRCDHSLDDILTIEPTSGNRRHTICVNLRAEPWDSTPVTLPSGPVNPSRLCSALLPAPFPESHETRTCAILSRDPGGMSPLSLADSEKYRSRPLDDLHRASGIGGGDGGGCGSENGFDLSYLLQEPTIHWQ